MTEHIRDKDQENYLLDQARTIRDEIEVSVFGPSGIDTPPCAEAWATAKLIAELRARVEELEVAQSPRRQDRTLPIKCRMRLQKAGLSYPMSGCEACGDTAPKWKECEVILNKNDSAEPDSSLVERVAGSLTTGRHSDARAAILEITAWLRLHTDLLHGPQCARWLEDELKKPL